MTKESPRSVAPAPAEELARLRRSPECRREAVNVGAKTAAIASIATAVPTAELTHQKVETAKLQAELSTKEAALQGLCLGFNCVFENRIMKLTAAYTIPWAKARLNFTAQALIISTAAVAAYFVGANQGSSDCAERIANARKAA